VTQHKALLELFRAHNNRLTLSQLMQPPLGREHSARMSELRRMGYTITCHRAGRAGENWYTLEEPEYKQTEIGEAA
jgi:hypothetical protein